MLLSRLVLAPALYWRQPKLGLSPICAEIGGVGREIRAQVVTGGENASNHCLSPLSTLQSVSRSKKFSFFVPALIRLSQATIEIN